MSRCFPFPRNGFAGNFSSNDALIVSIKLQEERENSIPDRVVRDNVVKSSDKKKDRKREKKDKKKNQKERKRNEKEKFISTVDSGKLKHDVKEVCKDKQSFEVLERSNLTEEHGRPVVAQNVSCSSDSTGNNSKRKIHSSLVNSIQGNGNIIRIRLASQRRDDPSSSGNMPCKDHCTSQSKLAPLSGPERSMSHKDVMHKVHEPSIVPNDVMPKVQESFVGHKILIPEVQEPSVGRTDVMLRVHESVAPREDPTSSGRIETREPTSKKLSSHEKKLLKREVLYTNLFENLSPTNLETALMVDLDDGEDWLCRKKDEERPAKRFRGGCNVVNLSCSASALLEPCADFLSDVGIYALPFTVPF